MTMRTTQITSHTNNKKFTLTITIPTKTKEHNMMMDIPKLFDLNYSRSNELIITNWTHSKPIGEAIDEFLANLQYRCRFCREPLTSFKIIYRVDNRQDQIFVWKSLEDLDGYFIPSI